MINDLYYRYSGSILKLQLTDTIDFAAFKQFMRSTSHQLIVSKNESGRFIVFIKNPRKELFAWAQDFTIIRGATYLWHNGQHVNRENYRTLIQEATETTPAVYSYLNWEEFTDEPPVSDAEMI